MTNKKSVVVVGSLSVDFVMEVPRRPDKGETIAGTSFNTYVGGKGNNQALAAARAGAPVAMVGKVGNDVHGQTIEKTLKSDRVDTKFLFHDNEVGTGIANIYVDPAGDNSIVIVLQANGRLSPTDVLKCKPLLREAGIVLMQMEIPFDTILAAAELAFELKVPLILNPAPAPSGGKLSARLLHCVDYLVPNQTEAELLTGVKLTDSCNLDDVKKAAVALQENGARNVIITLGEHGAFILPENGNGEHIPPFTVKAVDTTAAGDAFCGALAASLVTGSSLSSAVLFASAAGALATTKAGAEPSLPPLKEILNLSASRSASVR